MSDVTIAGIFDLSSFSWGEDLFNFTVNKLKDANPSVYRDLNHVVVDAACDQTTAVRAYWDLRTKNDEVPVHGIVGARCSGASVSLARIAGLEEVNIVSPSSTSSILSDVQQFPFFSRLVAPDDSRGEVGALVEILKWFGWSRVSILSTDTLYAKDYVSEFRKLWAEEVVNSDIPYSNVIRLDTNGKLDLDSVDIALREVPTDDPANNSRIIILIAQNQHAYPILQRADQIGFQPDTVWVGTSSWAGGRASINGVDPSLWLGQNEHPGYLGLGPINHPNADAYLQEFNSYREKAHTVYPTANPTSDMSDLSFENWDQFPPFAAEMIDSITALVRAIYSVPEENRRNGTLVRDQLRKHTFNGASGQVRFTSVGDRQDPQYSIVHLRRSHSGSLEWVTVGESGTSAESATVDVSQMCFATFGCGLLELPSDSYPVPPISLQVWVIVLLVILSILFIAVTAKYWRSRKSKRKIKQELESFRDSVVGMRTAEALYVPSVGEKGQDTGGSNQVLEAQWCWKETEMVMSRHDDDTIVGDVKDCWIKYTYDANNTLENAFQQQGWEASVSPLPGYVVDFQSMTQTKTQTGFVREVRRLVNSTSAGGSSDPLRALPACIRASVTSSEVKFGADLPEDIKNEPQMVLVPGDIIQISKQKKDSDWAFGTKLYHHDENVARSIVSGMTSNNVVSGDEHDSNVFVDTGWFQMEATRVPTTEDLEGLKQNVGDTDALNAPSHWNDITDPSTVQIQKLEKTDPEYRKVEVAFNSSLGRRVQIASIKRVENLGMWQSFVVKRQTIVSREIGQEAGVSNADTSKQRQQLERSWLWHGTNAEVMGKILQQGFNRSFCGKNATMYGKGVYFARDTSYSANATYSVPDSRGYQYIMACRVAVGVYCPGVTNSLTPDIRDAKTHALYDSTVGVLQNDSMSNPSIYVTYHDAQAYPEYLIKFKQ